MEEKLKFGDKIADKLSEVLGSWTFIGLQATVFACWMTINTIHPKGIDKYPFVFLNLIVGFESAFTAPILLMAGNRQSEHDRKKLLEDLELDRKNTEMLNEMTKHFDSHFHEIMKEVKKNK